MHILRTPVEHNHEAEGPETDIFYEADCRSCSDSGGGHHDGDRTGNGH